MKRAAVGAVVAVSLLAAAGCGSDEPEASDGASGNMILATTTSTQDSGLLDEILPLFDKRSDCTVKTVAVGSGQAIEMGVERRRRRTAGALTGGRGAVHGRRPRLES